MNESYKTIFKDKIILVTGGCGSIGSKIVKELLKYDPKVIRVFDNSEPGHFRFSQEIKSNKIRHLIGDIRDKERVIRAMEDVNIVFHAAALKHVPFCEYNPFEAVYTNVIGTKNLVDAAIHSKVEKFIGISTDKAVNPVNTMGATKLLAEKIITNAPIGKSNVKFCCVRFGNVLNTDGSVIPLFKSQISKGGPVTITSTEMTRFFMSLDDSVNLVLKASELAEGGEIFILKMNTLKIVDLAEVLVEEWAPISGFEPQKIIREIIGVRPGEKIHEPLMTNEELGDMIELNDMFVLRMSPLTSYGPLNVKDNNSKKIIEYNSGKLKLLTKEEIRQMLVRDKII